MTAEERQALIADLRLGAKVRERASRHPAMDPIDALATFDAFQSLTKAADALAEADVEIERLNSPEPGTPAGRLLARNLVQDIRRNHPTRERDDDR